MAQWIVILVVLVCLSGSSFSRSWVGFDGTDDFESWQADHDDYGSNQHQKSRYHSGEDSWGSDEDFDESGYENGYEHDKPISSNNGYYKDHGSQGYHGHHQIGHHHDHGYEHDKPISSNNGYYKDHGSQGYHDHHQVGHHHDHGYNDNGGYHEHHTQDSPGQPDQYWGSHGHHGQNGYAGQPGEDGVSHGHHQIQTGSPHQHGQNMERHGHNTQEANPGQPGNAQSTGPSRGLPLNNMNRPQIPKNDADRIVFPDLTNQVPTTRSPSTTRPATTTPQTSQATTTDRTLLDLVICIRACPATSEYNPVCGTNNVTYNNPGALQCARNCGLDVAVARRAPCPRLNLQPPITSRPITNPTDRPLAGPLQGTTVRSTTSTVNPTRVINTNINVNLVNKPGTTIPIEILQNVFGNAPPTSNTDEPEFDIDKRRKP